MSLEQTEQECAANATMPRVSLRDIEAAIVARNDFTLGDALTALGQPTLGQHPILSICALTMKNGFMVIGKSAPADPGNFNRELGRKLAYEDAVRQLWPLMGFALRQKLYEEAPRAMIGEDPNVYDIPLGKPGEQA